MKSKYLKYSVLTISWLCIALAAAAQTKPSDHTAYDYTENHSNYDRIHTEGGKQVEEIAFYRDDKRYKAGLVNDKLTSLNIDGKEIPAAEWFKYADAIAVIREQIAKNKIQAEKNRQQAIRNEEQAKRNEEQAARNEEQAKRNEIQQEKNKEQAARNAEQAKLNQAQEEKNRDQVARNEEQAKRNKIQDEKNAEQAVRNEAQARLNREQEKRNAEQAARNEDQAKRNEIQAAENEKLMKELTTDLVNDKIIPNDQGLHELRLNRQEMTVNGVKQPENIYKKYIEKYGKRFNGDFSFSNEGTIGQEH